MFCVGVVDRQPKLKSASRDTIIVRNWVSCCSNVCAVCFIVIKVISDGNSFVLFV